MEQALIGAVQGAPGEAIQAMFSRLVRETPALKIAGVIELKLDRYPDEVMQSITDGACFEIFQALGAGAKGCGLDPRGVVLAGAAIERDIEAGCDLVILSKFGKLESDRDGLISAYQAAAAAGVPVLTSVSPKWQNAWEAFAGGQFEYLPADFETLTAWTARATRREAALIR